MSVPTERELADAIRDGAARDAERRGTGRHRGTVTSADPLRVDVHGLDLTLGPADLTLTRMAAPPAVGDVVVLLEVDEDEWSILGVEPGDDEPEPVDMATQAELDSVESAADARLDALDARLDALEAKRTVDGDVAADGSESSSEFSAVKTGTGLYAVTFTTPFSATPRILLGWGDTPGGGGAEVQGKSASGFAVVTYNTAGVVLDNSFSFIATGPA